MLNITDIPEQYNSLPLYVTVPTFTRMKKDNLLDYNTFDDVQYFTIGDHLVLADRNSNDDDILGYSLQRRDNNPSRAVQAYYDHLVRVKAEWAAKPLIYRVRIHLNLYRIYTIDWFSRTALRLTAWIAP